MFLKKLREQTATHHQALEQNEYASVLLSDRVSIADYRLYLEKLYGFVKPFEDLIYPRLSLFIPDIDKRRKLQLLESDLRKLGNDNPNKLFTIPASRLNEIYTTPARAMGGFYVLEGSVLGGAVIHKHLISILGDSTSTSYLMAYGKSTGSTWKGFLDILNNFALEHNSDDIINGAVGTFETLNALFSVGYKTPA